MRGRGVAILLVIFVVMAGLLYLQDTGTIGEAEPTPPPTAILNRVFPELAVSDIIALQVQSGDLTLTIARDNQGNWIAPSLEAPLDQSLVQQIVGSVVLLPYTRSIAPPENGDLAQFGFRQPPAFMVSAITTNEEHAVIIGDFLQSGTEYYALIDDRPEIYIVQRGAIDFIAVFLVEPPISQG